MLAAANYYLNSSTSEVYMENPLDIVVLTKSPLFMEVFDCDIRSLLTLEIADTISDSCNFNL